MADANSNALVTAAISGNTLSGTHLQYGITTSLDLTGNYVPGSKLTFGNSSYAIMTSATTADLYDYQGNSAGSASYTTSYDSSSGTFSIGGGIRVGKSAITVGIKMFSGKAVQCSQGQLLLVAASINALAGFGLLLGGVATTIQTLGASDTATIIAFGGDVYTLLSAYGAVEDDCA